MEKTRPHVEPVAGQVIPSSTLLILAGLGLLLLALVGGILLCWAWWTDTPLPLPLFGDRDARWQPITGLFMASISALFLPMAILYLGSRERLIIAADRLQIVQRLGKGPEVVLQIPFRNIAKIACVDVDGVQRL